MLPIFHLSLLTFYPMSCFSHSAVCQALRNLQIAFGPLLDGHTLEEVTLWADEIYQESDINLTKGSPLKTKTDSSLTNTTLGLVVLDDIVEVVLPGTCVCVRACARATCIGRLTDMYLTISRVLLICMLFYCRWSCIPSRPKKGRSYSYCKRQGVA